jgi:HEAT repeats
VREVVRQLLAAAGGALFERCLADFERLDESGCDLLFAVRDGSVELPVGATGAHPRDIAEDVWWTFVVAARRWPDRFLGHVVSDPTRHADITILRALGEVDRPAARALLVAATNERQAGHALCREYALRALVQLADPAVPDVLVRLVKDRSSSVRHAALVAAVKHGDARLIPILQHIANAPKTPPGSRSQALDAIKRITARKR